MTKPTGILSIDASRQRRVTSRPSLSTSRSRINKKSSSEKESPSKKGSQTLQTLQSHAEKLLSSGTFRKYALIVLVAILLIVFFYPPIQQYYKSVRENALLEAQYEAISQRLDSLNSEVDTLSEDSGIEDFAREHYGWVAEDENAVSVYGLETQDNSATSSADGTTLHFSLDDVEMPQTWYSPVLDVIFGVG